MASWTEGSHLSSSLPRIAIFPLVGLTIPDTPFGGVFEFGKASFRRADKLLPLVKQYYPLFDNTQFLDSFTNNSESFLVMEDTGSGKHLSVESEIAALHHVHALAAINTMFSVASPLTFGFGIAGAPLVTSHRRIILDPSEKTSSSKFEQRGAFHGVALDEGWKNECEFYGFLNLLAIFSDGSLDAEWRRQLFDATASLGRSSLLLDLSQAFLAAVAGLETVLTVPYQRSGRELAKKIHGLFGWIPHYTAVSVEKELEDIFQVRHEMVHDCLFRGFRVAHLRTLQTWLANVLLNTGRLTAIYKNKTDFCSALDSCWLTKTWIGWEPLSIRLAAPKPDPNQPEFFL